MTAEFRIETSPVSDEAAQGEAKEMFDSTRAEVGFVPNMYRAMAIDPGVLSTYMHGYSQFREQGHFDPREQETVFLTISRANECGYCIAAHSMLAVNVSNLTPAETDALREGRALDDPKLQALSSFTHHMWQTRGRPTEAAAAEFKDAGFGDIHVMEIILAMAVKTLSNYSNHVNQPEVDDAFAAHKVEEAA